MGFLKPEVEGFQPKSQATPLSGDILSMLRGLMSGGQFGEPIGPGQQAAAGGIQDFISARETPDQFLELMGPLRESFNRETGRIQAQQKETFGGLGNRFSTSLARETGRVGRERGTDLDAMISQMFLQDQGSLLQALGMQQQFGQQATQPFFDCAKLGIVPEEPVVTDSPWTTLLQILTEAAGAAAMAL